MNKVYAVLYPLVWIYMKLLHPWKAVGLEHVPEGAALLCGNHSTLGDPLYVVCCLGWRRQVHVMAKEEIMNWPVIGFLLKKAGIFGVKRGKADVGALKEAMRILRGDEKLLMFPQGTRVKEGEDSEARTGAAMFATRTGVPLVPIYVQRKKRLFARNVVVIGQPYHPQYAGRKPTPDELDAITGDLMDRVHALGEGQS